ncbi:MAG: hypothetical protein VKJ64_13340 [Leptolyngbyaceae bacterium]|nr:hypothetical protein [Leptolyngbyaceae bacterium]
MANMVSYGRASVFSRPRADPSSCHYRFAAIALLLSLCPQRLVTKLGSLPFITQGYATDWSKVALAR